MANESSATVRHTLPGRVRLSAPRLAWHRGACTRVAQALAGEGSFARVTVRPVTGSVIIEGDPGSLASDRLLARLEDLVGNERDDEGKPLGVPCPRDQPGPTRVAHAVAHAVAGINADVRVALDGRADLGTLLPVLFALGGVAEISATGQMPAPTWFSLLWWSLRSFMTFNIRAVEEEVQGVHDGHDPERGLVSAL